MKHNYVILLESDMYRDFLGDLEAFTPHYIGYYLPGRDKIRVTAHISDDMTVTLLGLKYVGTVQFFKIENTSNGGDEIGMPVINFVRSEPDVH